ncbi:outer membrane protein [Paragemmobacter aquarius]|nr:outer membrane beta-barrel protein [Gemmobacter aquarius]
MAGGPAAPAAESAVATSAPARAASPFDGAWAGISVGKGYSSIGVTAGIGPQEGIDAPFVGDLISLAYPDSGASGRTLGVEAGYGRSFGNGWYWGAQLDHTSTAIDANANLKLSIVNPIQGPNPYPPSGEADFGYRVGISSMTSALGRIGYQLNDHSMVYGLGGITAARGNASLEGLSTSQSGRSFTAAAVTLGMGIETLVGEKTSLKLEYRSSNFGDQTIESIDSTVPSVPLNFHATASTRADTIRVVLAHRF